MLSDTFILDAALQYYVIHNCGVPLEDISIIGINPEHINNEKSELHNYFIIKSVLSQVLEKQNFVKNQIELAKSTLALKRCPDIATGSQCYKPYKCDFIGYCHQRIPLT